MKIYAFLGGMWGLIIIGGGLAVTVLGPLDLGTYGVNATVKGGVAILLVVLWVFILVKLTRYIFR
ncbi:MAG: hypothetical protein F4Y82_06635 [Cenarchaeum sp. SB0665_bin_23]|nr:hypothetical protein [Cenarchaeum sp. SB0667_bin_13]MXY37318.1 hypothetical protein [Cenarchaeum sp. SB0664_bin_35]MXY61767.1 hypothetical protein [Cenarchaeum sp. SB0665_bin_23]MXZ93564.1 hypothetical protein [Cenarchaeum sp. SB0666_bin_15]MYB47208.1 hypothetical protein [Cenarchaeum sp. SB0662_bin_33]MYC80252.1 hypothetical protein [Cenarchaeum sp. SB0661_bin_35]MYD58655.1 hypothetical protein [Cenarchaeum sp. SB0678_bin_8]MYG32555.1 hypothetical protein [Cenarchaeum sp. SB0677_bin_16]